MYASEAAGTSASENEIRHVVQTLMAKRRSLDDKNCLSSTEDVRGLPELHAANWEQDSPAAHTSSDQNPELSTGTTAGLKGFPSLTHGTFPQANEQEPSKIFQRLPSYV